MLCNPINNYQRGFIMYVIIIASTVGRFRFALSFVGCPSDFGWSGPSGPGGGREAI